MGFGVFSAQHKSAEQDKYSNNHKDERPHNQAQVCQVYLGFAIKM